MVDLNIVWIFKCANRQIEAFLSMDWDFRPTMCTKPTCQWRSRL